MAKLRKHHTSTKYGGYKKIPGHVLVEDFLVPYGGDIYSLSVRTKIPHKRLFKLIRGTERIDQFMADRLAAFYNNDPSFWLQLQENFEKGIPL